VSIIVVVVVVEALSLKYVQRAEDWDRWRREEIVSVVEGGLLLLVEGLFDGDDMLLLLLLGNCRPLTFCRVCCM